MMVRGAKVMCVAARLAPVEEDGDAEQQQTAAAEGIARIRGQRAEHHVGRRRDEGERGPRMQRHEERHDPIAVAAAQHEERGRGQAEEDPVGEDDVVEQCAVGPREEQAGWPRRPAPRSRRPACARSDAASRTTRRRARRAPSPDRRAARPESPGSGSRRSTPRSPRRSAAVRARPRSPAIVSAAGALLAANPAGPSTRR